MATKNRFFLAQPLRYLRGHFSDGITIHEEEQTNVKVATIAGGCFWCGASGFENVAGVARIISSYAGGQKEKTHL